MLCRDAALVGAEQPALEQRGDPVDGGHRDVGRVVGRADRGDDMFVAELGQVLVGAEPVGGDDRAGLADVG